MKRIIVFVLLAIGTFVEADAQIFSKEARREARELKRMGWKSLTDEPIIQQLASAWDLSVQVDSAGSAAYAFQSSYAEGHSIEAALDSALYYLRIGAINTLSKCYSYTITDTDGKTFSVLGYTAPESWNGHLAVQAIIKDPVNHEIVDVILSGYEPLVEDIQQHECIVQSFWRRKGENFEVYVVGVYPVAELSKNPYITQSIVSFSPQI